MTWSEGRAKEIDDTYSRIFASPPSKYLEGDHPEMLLVTETLSPDFTDLIRLSRDRTVDNELKHVLYQTAAPELFDNLKDPHIDAIRILERPVVTFVRARISGKINGTAFVYEHLFVIPDPTLVPDGIGLLLVVTYLDYHASWMEVVASQIFQAVQSQV
jgi:hypothetical protein